MKTLRRVEFGIGAVIGVGAIGAFVLALRAPPPEDLSVHTESHDTYLLMQKDPEGEIVVEPKSLLPRVTHDKPPGESSIDLFTYRAVYGKRWEREITVPSVNGPILPEGSAWPCAVKVRMAPSLLDDGKDHQGDVVSILDHRVREQFPREIKVGSFKVLSFARVRESHYAVSTDKGKITLTGNVTLDDDDEAPTQFVFTAALVLKEKAGDLEVGLDSFDLDWKGKTRRAFLVELADLLTDVEKLAQTEVKKEVGKVLPFLRLPKEAFDLAKLSISGPSAPKAAADAALAGALSVRLCSAPVVDKNGIVFELGTKVDLTGPRRSMAIKGPSALKGKPAPLEFPDTKSKDDGSSNLEIIASGDALQETLYLLWQSRVLDAWGKDPKVLDAFRAQLQDRLALEVTGLDLNLPPAFVSGLEGCPGFGIRLADATFGRTDEGWDAIVHADLCAIPTVHDSRIDLDATLRYVAVDCDAGHQHTLRPCLSDVVPVLRAEDLSRYKLPLSMPIPERLLRVSLVKDASLTVDNLTAETRQGVLDLKARAQLLPETK